MAGLSGSIKKALQSVMPKLFNDQLLTASASYHQYVSTSYDQAEGHSVDVYEDHVITALVLDEKVAPQKSEDSKFEGRKAEIMVKQSEVNAWFSEDDVLRDKITMKGIEYDVTSFDKVLDELYTFTLEQ